MFSRCCAACFGVASGVDAPLSTCPNVLDRGAQADAQTAACSDATLPQQKKSTRQMSRKAV
jgi:hypothetical protein